ncbi:MAG: hypothetical protein HYW88_00665, partial [Candidatus Sungbacteria bacterium]|nr:hypothetical protein [Candidatus Sungbacteria bacterium]
MKKLAVHAVFSVFFVIVSYGCSSGKISEDSPLYETYRERTKLISQMRDFERKIGYKKTKNFYAYSDEAGYPVCYYARFDYLPHSYMDFGLYGDYRAGEAIGVKSEKNCTGSSDKDMFFYRAEAIAGIGGTPLTPPMLEAQLGRFMSVVFHEDFHDQ